MDRTGNYVSHSDIPPGSPRRLPKKKFRNTAEVTDYASDFTATSTKTPSIVGLENLHVVASDHFTAPPVPTSRFMKTPGKKAVEVFRPTLHASEDRKHTQVFVKAVILKVGEIETIKEYFEADVFIQARWREPVLDNSTEVNFTLKAQIMIVMIIIIMTMMIMIIIHKLSFQRFTRLKTSNNTLMV